MKSFQQFLDLIEEKDACYHKAMKSHGGKWSARAAQQAAKCRKASGKVRKTEGGKNLKRWGAEKWVNTKSGEPCGSEDKGEYCRPSKKVSKETPKTKGEMSPKELKSKQRQKSKVGEQGASGKKVSPVK